MEDIIIILIIAVVLFFSIKRIIEPQKWIILSKAAAKSDTNYLEKFYFRKAKKHKYRVGFRIILLIMLPVLNIWGISAGKVAIADEPLDIFLLGFSFLTSCLVLVYIVYYYLQRMKRLIPKATYVEINLEDYKEIGDICNAIIDKLGLKGLKLKMYYVKTNRIEAHITLEGGKAHLFLSRGLISYSHHALKEVESILGHEFGHIVQGDSKLFLITKRAFRFPIVINNIQLVLTLVLVVLTFMADHRQAGAGLTQLTIVLFYRWLYSGVNKFRKEAEFLADLCSVIFIENSQIATIIKNYLPDIQSPNYPSKKERLGRIAFVSRIINSSK